MLHVSLNMRRFCALTREFIMRIYHDSVLSHISTTVSSDDQPSLSDPNASAAGENPESLASHLLQLRSPNDEIALHYRPTVSTQTAQEHQLRRQTSTMFLFSRVVLFPFPSTHPMAFLTVGDPAKVNVKLCLEEALMLL